MPPIGFSTGALAKGDFRAALTMLADTGLSAVELSALRPTELPQLLDALPSLPLAQFPYISLHAPSSYDSASEQDLVCMLEPVLARNWPIVVHPDVIRRDELWQPFGSLLCLENMDHRKPIGRTFEEMKRLFERFPEASFCCDLGHAHQIDPTMTQAYCMLERFASRLRQVHLSEVNPASRHEPLSLGTVLAFGRVAHLIPQNVPVILESPIPAGQILDEVDTALSIFSPVRLRAFAD